MLTGTYYGVAAGGLLEVAINSNLSPEQAKLHINSLAQRCCLVGIKGTNDEIVRTESALKV